MIIIGIALLIIGLALIAAFINFRIRCKTRILATVSRLGEKKIYLRGRTAKEYTPFFTYTVGGREYTEKAEVSTMRSGKFSIGDKVNIFADIDHPENIRYGSGIGYLLSGCIILAVGCLFTVLYFW